MAEIPNFALLETTNFLRHPNHSLSLILLSPQPLAPDRKHSALGVVTLKIKKNPGRNQQNGALNVDDKYKDSHVRRRRRRSSRTRERCCRKCPFAGRKKAKLRRNHLETTHGVSHCIRLTSSGEYFIKVYQRLLEGGESKKKKKLRTEAPEETRPVEKCDQTSKSRHIPGRRQENCGGKYQHHNGKVKMLERHFSFRGWSLVCLCVSVYVRTLKGNVSPSRRKGKQRNKARKSLVAKVKRFHVKKVKHFHCLIMARESSIISFLVLFIAVLILHFWRGFNLSEISIYLGFELNCNLT